MKTFANLIYKKAIDYAGKKQSTKLLAFISFIESFIFPLPTDIFLIPMIIAKRNKYLFLIILTTIFSVLGGMIGYFIGYYFWDILEPFFIKLYPGFEINFENFKEKFSQDWMDPSNDWWIYPLSLQDYYCVMRYFKCKFFCYLHSFQLFQDFYGFFLLDILFTNLESKQKNC